ncbi:MAG TPA: tyrosine-type recombinase/integrase [Gemmataceae bacterium]|jgi:integrase
MAHLVRPKIVRYIDPKTHKRVPKGTPGAKRVKEKAAKWYAAGVPGWPKSKRVPLASDKTAAQQLLADLVKRAEWGEAGVSDPFAEHRARPLAEHLSDFERAIEAKGKTSKHARQTAFHVRTALDGCKFKLFGEVKPMPVLDWLTAERRAGRIGATTAAYYVRDLKAFFRWMVKFDRAAKNPLAALEIDAAPDGDVGARRVLPPPELALVFDAARGSTRRFKGLDGPARLCLYLAACATGYRAQELASLVPESFHLDDDPPAIHLSRRRTKNRKRADQPIPSTVAAALRTFLAGRPVGERVWPGSWWRKAAEMLRIDLEAAGVPYRVAGPDGPLVADFHCLRHSYITMLDQAGATPAQAQKLARHSDIKLTLQRYTHHGRAELAATVERLALPAAGVVDVNPLAALSRTELEHTVGVLLVILGALVAPRVAPRIGTIGDQSGQAETKAADTGAAAQPPNCLRIRDLELVGTVQDG